MFGEPTWDEWKFAWNTQTEKGERQGVIYACRGDMVYHIVFTLDFLSMYSLEAVRRSLINAMIREERKSAH